MIRRNITLIYVVFLLVFNANSQITEKWIKFDLVAGDDIGNVSVWNPGSILMADVIEYNGGFRMYYTLSDSDSTQIRYADSPDALNWTDGGLIMSSDTSKLPTNRQWLIGGASVVELDTGGYRMYYRCTPYFTSGAPLYHVRSLISPDGTTFTEEPGVRIEINPPDTNSPVQLAGHGTYFINDSGTVTGVFSGDLVGVGGPSELFITTSTDGLTFSNFTNQYEDWHDPIVVKKNGEYILYATYLQDKQGKAVSSDGINWPAQMDSVSFQDSLGNILTVASIGVGDIGGLTMPNDEIWLYTNYGAPSKDIALFKLSNPTTSFSNCNDLVTYKLFPNPLSGNSIIEFEYSKNVSFTLFDNQGKIISEKNVKRTNRIDLGEYVELRQGTYFFKLIVDEKTTAGKIIKM